MKKSKKESKEGILMLIKEDFYRFLILKFSIAASNILDAT